MRLSDYYTCDYRVSFVNCLRQYWKYEKVWSCIGRPKEFNILLYLDGCSARYTLKNGQTFVAEDSNVVFCPKGSEYSVEFFDFKEDGAGTVGINFSLESKEPLPDVIECFAIPGIRSSVMEMELLRRTENRVVAKYNALLYGLLTTFGENSEKGSGRDDFGAVSVGVNYLREHLCEDVGIDKLASLCNMSEVYFRRVFKRSFGTSPSKYRLNLRLRRAAEYLRYTDISVSEIAELLGFADSSYFIKRFKENYSVTPLSYRNNF
jgi:AraC-like DNA-binding protein